MPETGEATQVAPTKNEETGHPTNTDEAIQDLPPFKFCQPYDGSEPAARWLKRLEYDLRSLDKNKKQYSEQYLSAVNVLLGGEAADWAESSPEIRNILAGSPDKDNKESRYTEKSRQRFLLLFKERFPTKADGAPTVSFPEALEALHQNADESLSSYYHRTMQITSRYGVRDHVSGATGGTALTTLESSTLDLVYRAVLRGLTDRELRCEAVRANLGGESLYTALTAMEEAYKSRRFIKKIEHEEARTREASFYKDLLMRNISASQLESMMASYQAGNKVPDQKIPQQFLLPSPESCQKQPSRPAIESKSVTWSVDPLDGCRAISGPGSGCWLSLAGASSWFTGGD